MQSVLIVSEIGLYREGLEIALRNHGEFPEIRTESSSGAALKLAATMQPQIVLLDRATEGGLDTVRELSTRVPAPSVIVLAVPDAVDDILACAEAGAAAYVTREASVSDLIGTIQAAVAGEVRCSTRVTGALFRRLSCLAEKSNGTSRHESLSRRETEILGLIVKEFSNKEIARSLGIEVSTVKNHVHHILEKLNVRRRSEAAALVRGVL